MVVDATEVHYRSRDHERACERGIESQTMVGGYVKKRGAFQVTKACPLHDVNGSVMGVGVDEIQSPFPFPDPNHRVKPCDVVAFVAAFVQ